MIKKYILTGGPGSGKTSILNALRTKGEYIINEAATDYIKQRQAQGVIEPWKESDFQKKILKLQLEREKNIPSTIERVFIDRGLADGLVYVEPDSKLSNQIIKESKKNIYDRIFFIDPLYKVEKNEIRREDKEGALGLGAKLKKAYYQLGYELISVAPDTIAQRVRVILNNLD